MQHPDMTTNLEKLAYLLSVLRSYNEATDGDGFEIPEKLWYYTSGATLFEIIKYGEIWSTHISCLNDQTEFRHGIELIKKEVDRRLETEPNPETRSLLEFVSKHISGDAVLNSYFFVLCFSTRRNDLSQWRAYGGGENGVSLGLDLQRLKFATEKSPKIGRYLMRVLYDDRRKVALVASIVSEAIEHFQKGLQDRPGVDIQAWINSFLQQWEQLVALILPTMKDSAFSAENEVRLVVTYRPGDEKSLKFQQRAGMLSRHLPISFDERLPITDVLVGPCRHAEISRVTVGDLLKAYDYGAKVSLSGIPYQVP